MSKTRATATDAPSHRHAATRTRLAWTAAGLLAAVLAWSAQGQVFVGTPGTPTATAAPSPGPVVYAGKFVCGGHLLLGPIPVPGTLRALPGGTYSGFEPGNYATAINVLNVDVVRQDRIQVLASVDGALGPVLVATFDLEPFETRKLDCVDIVSAVNGGTVPPGGPLYEGFVHIVRNLDVLAVQGVYTHSHERRFESANGAGGLGRGTSIDVEPIPARPLPQSSF